MKSKVTTTTYAYLSSLGEGYNVAMINNKTKPLKCTDWDTIYKNQPFCQSKDEQEVCYGTFYDASSSAREFKCEDFSDGEPKLFFNVDGESGWGCAKDESTDNNNFYTIWQNNKGDLQCDKEGPGFKGRICVDGQCIPTADPFDDRHHFESHNCSGLCGCISSGSQNSCWKPGGNNQYCVSKSERPPAYPDILHKGQSKDTDLRGAVYNYRVWKDAVKANNPKKPNGATDPPTVDTIPTGDTQSQYELWEAGSLIYDFENSCECNNDGGNDKTRAYRQGNACQESICWWRPTCYKPTAETVKFASHVPGSSDDIIEDAYCNIYGTVQYDINTGKVSSVLGSSGSEAWDHVGNTTQNTSGSCTKPNFQDDDIAKVYFYEEPVHKDTGNRCYAGIGECGCGRIRPSAHDHSKPAFYGGGDFNLLGCIAACPPGATCNFVASTDVYQFGIPKDWTNNVSEQKQNLSNIGGFCYACPSTAVPISEFLNKHPGQPAGERSLTHECTGDKSLQSVKDHCGDPATGWGFQCSQNTFKKHAYPKDIPWVKSAEEPSEAVWWASKCK